MSLDFGPSNYILTGVEYLHGTKPIVYAWKRGETYLYIGMSESGVKRIYTHNIIGVADHVDPLDMIEIIICDNRAHALFIENDLIGRHNPKYNQIKPNYAQAQFNMITKSEYRKTRQPKRIESTDRQRIQLTKDLQYLLFSDYPEYELKDNGTQFIIRKV